MSTMFTGSMRKQFDEVLQKNEQGGPFSNHEGIDLPKMDSKTCYHPQWYIGIGN